MHISQGNRSFLFHIRPDSNSVEFALACLCSCFILPEGIQTRPRDQTAVLLSIPKNVPPGGFRRFRQQDEGRGYWFLQPAFYLSLGIIKYRLYKAIKQLFAPVLINNLFTCKQVVNTAYPHCGKGRIYKSLLARVANSERSPFSSVMCANSFCPNSLSIMCERPLLCSSR